MPVTPTLVQIWCKAVPRYTLYWNGGTVCLHVSVVCVEVVAQWEHPDLPCPCTTFAFFIFVCIMCVCTYMCICVYTCEHVYMCVVCICTVCMCVQWDRPFLLPFYRWHRPSDVLGSLPSKRKEQIRDLNIHYGLISLGSSLETSCQALSTGCHSEEWNECPLLFINYEYGCHGCATQGFLA